jgi:sulfur dioxygenase
MADAPSPLPHPFSHPQRPGAVPLISPGDLRRMRESVEPPIILDVRSNAERAVAHLPADRHIPLAELPARVRELPQRQTIVVYDQFGSSARRAAGFLRERGFERAAALEGGLDEYARLVDPAVPRYQWGALDPDLVFRQMPRAETGCLSYLVGDPSTRAAIVIDPGREVEPYLQALAEGDWRLVAVVETHTHADHLAGHARLHEKTDAPIYVGRLSPALYPHRSLSEGDELEFGNEALRVWETPGHTRDHLSLKVRDRVFTGDTLLIGACGRTDLGDGSPELLWESLTQKLLALRDDTEVFPAHFGPRHALVDRYSSTIGFERATNEALNQGSREAFLEYMTEGWPPKPADFDRIVAENLAR